MRDHFIELEQFAWEFQKATAAIIQKARATLLDRDGERRFAILAAFVAASPAGESAALVKDVVPRLEKAFASLTERQDVRALERVGFVMKGGRVVKNDLR